AEIDLLLVMSVNPGFGGQAFIESTTDKVARARSLLTSRHATAELEVDGGINCGTIGRAIAAGAAVVVAGAAVFRPDASVQQAVAELRAAASGVALVH
ncbi:MAG TPA: ribulose-phosphate 3-epimerase, partial [Ktedonobacterales bacterium]|nr:ribulose-phosphate 3-epimerase [Ktedonobacterales bacterium]